MYFNPYNQNRLDNLMQQKNMIEQQIQSLQQMQVPPININNNIPSNNMTPQTNYDGNFKWVDGEEQARQVANNNLPLILFDNNNPIFYMKNVDGTFKKYQFTEIIDQPQESMEDKINALEGKFNALLKRLSQPNTNTPTASKTAVKQAEKGDK